MADLNAIRGEAEAFCREISLEHYRGSAGLKEEVDYVSIYERHQGLFRREVVEEVNRLAASPAGRDGRLPLLREFLVLEHIGDQLKALSQEAVNFESAAKVRMPDGSEMAYRLSAVALINEADRGRREQIDLARQGVVRVKNKYLVPLHQRTHAFAGELGFGSYLGMMKALKPYALEPIREEMARFSARTEALYREEMGKALEDRLGIDLAQAKRHDISHLFRGGEFDGMFPREGMVERLRKSASAMGLDIEAGGRVLLDIEERPRKSPRAFCAPVEVPGKVFLVIMPRGGHDDYHAFLHELGHALHYAHVAEGAPFEHKWLGDNSITEGFAMLFDHLMLNGEWLARALGARESRDYLRLGHLYELYMLRRYAAKIDYELKLHQGPELERKEDLYARTLGAATMAEYPPVSYLDDVDGFFYCANYLRAWMFSAQLAACLRRDFGEEWFADPRSGEVLRDLWAKGQGEPLDALLNHLGIQGLSSAPLAEAVEGGLGA